MALDIFDQNDFKEKVAKKVFEKKIFLKMAISRLQI